MPSDNISTFNANVTYWNASLLNRKLNFRISISVLILVVQFLPSSLCSVATRVIPRLGQWWAMQTIVINLCFTIFSQWHLQFSLQIVPFSFQFAVSTFHYSRPFMSCISIHRLNNRNRVLKERTLISCLSITFNILENWLRKCIIFC